MPFCLDLTLYCCCITQPPANVQPVLPGGSVHPTPAQLAKLRSELDVVQGNITVMSEMLTEMTPGQEEAGDVDLLQVLDVRYRKLVGCSSVDGIVEAWDILWISNCCYEKHSGNCAEVIFYGTVSKEGTYV